jgi:hypothetical protein
MTSFGPAYTAFAITPHDTHDLPANTRSIYVAAAGEALDSPVGGEAILTLS